MYDIVSSIIDHVYQSNYGGDQQYIYYTCCVMIPLLTVVFVDAIRTGFASFLRK